MSAAVADGYRTRKTEPLVAAERGLIAEEVGLNTVHRLFGVGLKLQAISLRQQDSGLAKELERCMGDLDVAINDVRTLMFKVGSRHE